MIKVLKLIMIHGVIIRSSSASRLSALNHLILEFQNKQFTNIILI